MKQLKKNHYVTLHFVVELMAFPMQLRCLDGKINFVVKSTNFAYKF